MWELSLPAIGENLLQTALLIVDTLMIAQFGSVALAASVSATTILWRAHMTLGGIDRGTVAMVSRYYGERNLENVGATVAQSIYLALAIGTGVGLVGLAFSRQFFEWMGASPQVVAEGTPFLRVIFLASAARMFFFVGSASLRAAGDTRSPMWITLGMNAVNLLFNYLLIFGHWGLPRLGLLGSGISTTLSIAFSAVALAWVLFQGRTNFRLALHHFRPNFGLMRTLLRIAAPSFIEEGLISIGVLVFFSFIAGMGTDVLAAHGISSRVESVSYMAGVGFAVAAATLVGQSLGMKSLDLARKSFYRSTLFCVLLMSVIAAGLILFATPLLSAFHPTKEVLQIAQLLLVIAAIEQPLLGITMTLGGGLRGAGDTVSPMYVSLAGNILIRIFLVHWLAFGLKLGIYGVYLGTVIDWLVRSALLFYFYHQGRWARVRI